MGFGFISMAVQYSYSGLKYLESVRQKICTADRKTHSVFV